MVNETSEEISSAVLYPGDIHLRYELIARSQPMLKGYMSFAVLGDVLVEG
jgi:hypothetical protein